MLRYFLILALLITDGETYGQYMEKLSGITLVAPRDSFQADPMPDLKNINSSWVAVVPYAFTPDGEPVVRYGGYQWWGETPQGAEATIRLAKKNGLKVMLKPQVWIHNLWVGDLEYNSEEDWSSWEKSYRQYILEFATIAERNGVELFCLGTEFKKSVKQRPAFWVELIRDVRRIYSGLVSYCANWDEFEDVPFWSELDLIGISAYFPLTKTRTPSVDELVAAWKPVKKRIRKTSLRNGRPVFFAEYGYLSLDGTAWQNWELEKQRRQTNENEQAQANALEALYQSFHDEKFWAGGFLWKWYPNGHVRPGFRDKDYTPQGKIAETVIRKWHEEINNRQFYASP